ncbi:MAG: hypothetical protein HY791_33765 [Deltaproteobacteria bacterium]|nr:hypothetical protein [Deltaproteobacteria bacterium]
MSFGRAICALGLAGLVGCSGETESTDAGVRPDSGPANHCPTYEGAKVDATGLFGDQAFTLACRFDTPAEEARYTTTSGQGYIKCKSTDFSDLTFTIDVRSEPVEEIYADGKVIHLRAGANMLEMRGDATNVTQYRVEVTCWDFEKLQVGGSFNAEWFDDGSPPIPDPAAFTAAGAIQGTFMVRFNER